MTKWACLTIYIVVCSLESFVNPHLDRDIKSNRTDYDDRFGHVAHVTVIFRHGDRTACKSYPLDPYLNYTWPPDGRGMLTRRGKQRAYDLGKLVRNRYPHLVKSITSHRNISVLSSYTSRTIMSAQCFVAAFYLPRANTTIKKNLLWQPVPVFAIPTKRDNLFSRPRVCSLYNEIVNETYASEKMKKIYDKHLRTIRRLEKHSGLELSKEDMATLDDQVFFLFDTLLVQKEHGMKLPSWTKKINRKKVDALQNDIERVFKKSKYASKLSRLRDGPLLSSITEGIKSRMNKTSPVLFNLYSGHESTVSRVMVAFGIYDNISPHYSAALIVEVRKKLGEKIVAVFYANSTTSEPHFLEIPKCKSPCTLKKFLKTANRLIPADWRGECNGQREE